MLSSVSSGILNQYVAGLSASFGALICASCFGWITPVFNHLLGPDSEIPVTPSEAAWIVAIIELGSLASSLPAGYLVNYFGRKPTILATGPIFVISWIVVLYLRSAFSLVLSRIIQGLAIGIVFTAAPIYLGEISSNSVRGSITSMFYTAFWIGYVIEYVAGAFLSFYDFTYFTLALNVPYIILFSFQPESPFYLMMVGREESALQALEWFGNGSSQTEKEERIAELKQNTSATDKETRLKDVIATASDRKALTLLFILAVVRLFSGNGAITCYSTDMFYHTPNLSVEPHILTIAVGVVMFLGGCVATVTSDSLGRRPLLLISSIGAFICQSIAGTYYYLDSETSIDVSRYSWIAPVSILIYSGICTAGMAPVCSSYTSELFDTQNRGLASSITTITLTVFGFLIAIIYQPMTYHFGMYVNFYMYALCSLFGVIYFYFVAPETKGKSFTEIRSKL